MHNTTARLRYSGAAQLFHWLSVFLVGMAWILGLLGDDFPKGQPRHTAEFIHVSAGEIILALLLLRLLWRFVSPPPPEEASPLGPWVDLGAKLTHLALYALLLAVPLIGVVTLFAGGEALPLFGLGEIASPWARDRAFKHTMKEIHEVLAHGLIVLATLHAGAGLAHHFVFRDRVLQRMLPRFLL